MPVRCAIAVLPNDTLELTLDYLDTEALIAATLVCPAWNAAMVAAGMRAAGTGRLPIVPAHHSRPRSIPVHRFYRLQYLGGSGALCPLPGPSAIAANALTRPVPFPLPLPVSCHWDAVVREARGANADHLATVRLVDRQPVVYDHGPRADADRTLVASLAAVGVCERAFAAFHRMRTPRAEPTWLSAATSARAGPWVVTLPMRYTFSGAPAFYGAMLAVHGRTMAPCRGAAWDNGASLCVRDSPPNPQRRQLVTVSPSCAVLYEQQAPPGAPFVPTHVLWCSPRSGTDELVVRALPTAPRYRLDVAWPVPPHDFDIDAAVLAVRDPVCIFY